MIHQISNITILILVAWLSYTAVQNSRQLSHVQAQIAAQAAQFPQQVDFQSSASENLNKMIEFVNKQTHIDQQFTLIQGELIQRQHQVNLAKTLSDLLTAELLQKEAQYSEASKLLKASKENIWLTGDLYPAHKKQLQGLMQPIDESLLQWQNGTAQSIQSIYETVQSVISSMTEGK